MRLTLIQPCVGRGREHKKYIKTWMMEPLAHAQIASLTPKDVDIKFYDDRVEKIPYDEKTDLVGISVETYTARRAYQIASEFRKRGVSVVMGGFHATLAPEEAIEYAESVVIGEAEDLWPKVIEDFKKGKLEKFYRQISRPDLAGIKPDRSIYKGKPYFKIALVEAGRGCQYKCDFCAVQSFFKSTQKRRPLSDILDEIKELKKEGRGVIFFVDDNITCHKEEAKKLMRALIPLKIKWGSQASIHAAFDPEFLSLMKESGCMGVLVGFESLSKKNLNDMNKNFNKIGGGIENAIKNFRKYGIRLYPTFMFGYPDDDKEAFEKTLNFSKKQKFFLTAFNHLLPFPGTPLYKRLHEKNKLIYEKWWLDPTYRYGECPVKGDKLSNEEIRSNCISLRKSFYGPSSIISRLFDRVNCPDIKSAGMFLAMNILFRREIEQRNILRLGDLSFEGELIKSNNNS